jgi:hypothetical protein
VDGTSNAASVTVTGSNPYKWTVTLPALTAGQIVSMYITATIATIATIVTIAPDATSATSAMNAKIVNMPSVLNIATEKEVNGVCNYGQQKFDIRSHSS